MPSIVMQLQQQALDSTVAPGDLLRHALVVARKLGLGEFEAWISSELDGYGPQSELPEYRSLRGHVRALNPVRGWIPVAFYTSQQEASVSLFPCRQAIDEIHNLLSDNDGAPLVVPLPPELQRTINGRSGPQFEIALHLTRASLANVLSSVRNTILNWALQLEEDGIIGDGLSFSVREKEAAAAQAYSHVNNFYGSVGSAQIAQNSPEAVQVNIASSVSPDELRQLVRAIREQRSDIQLKTEEAGELEAELATIESQANSPRPKHTIIRESLETLQRILERAVGSASGHLILQIVDMLAR